MELHRVVLLLGSNIGDRKAILSEARVRITTLIGSIVLTSRECATEPYGAFASPDDSSVSPAFLNQALAVLTALEPEAVLDAIVKIERVLGRPEHALSYTTTGDRLYQNRTLDVDVMFYDDAVIDTKRLVIPHPRLHDRLFVLEPLTDIMPNYMHPILKMTMKELFNLRLLGDSQ